MEKSGLKGIILATNIVALFIMLVSMMILFFAIYRLVDPPIKSDKITIQKVEFVYKIDIDTTKIKELKDSTSLEYLRFVTKNNDKILENMNKVIQNQEKRVDEIIERNKIQSDFITYASAIFALILSIAGFFGFKSINEMKKEAIERAEKIAIEEAQSQFNKMNEKNDKKISNQITAITKKLIEENNSSKSDTETPDEDKKINATEETPFNDDQV